MQLGAIKAGAYQSWSQDPSLGSSVEWKTTDLCHCYSMHSAPCSAPALHSLSMASFGQLVAAADYLLLMALVVTRIEYVALELVAAMSTI